MILRWYKALERSGLYRAFLVHRVWTAKAILSTGILYCFPLGTLLIVWWFLPVTVLSVSWLLAATFAGVSEHTMLGLALLQLAYVVAAGPIVLRAFHDTFRGYFAGFSAVFCNKASVTSLLQDTQNELKDWGHQHV